MVTSPRDDGKAARALEAEIGRRARRGTAIASASGGRAKFIDFFAVYHQQGQQVIA